MGDRCENLSVLIHTRCETHEEYIITDIILGKCENVVNISLLSSVQASYFKILSRNIGVVMRLYYKTIFSVHTNVILEKLVSCVVFCV